MLYDANYDEELIREREQCKDICFEYNSTWPSLLHTKQDLLRSLFGKTEGDFYHSSPLLMRLWLQDRTRNVRMC